MNTLIFNSLDDNIDEITTKSAEILDAGGIVVFPTETVYGIGANPFNLDAVEKIYNVKARKKDNPLIFHISNLSMLKELAIVPEHVENLINVFMPGPLTLVLKSKIEKKYTFELDTIAARMPDNLIALKIIEKLSKPVVAPSANISGKPSGTEFAHVFEDFNGKVDVIINGGKTVYGIESTVIDVTTCPFLLLRAGAISIEDLEDKGISIAFPDRQDILRLSPGTRYKHYAPNALVVPFETEKELLEKVQIFKERKTAIMGTNSYHCRFDKIITFNDLNEYARLLYSSFRYLDAVSIEIIFAELPANRGIGLAIRDRIIRASQG